MIVIVQWRPKSKKLKAPAKKSGKDRKVEKRGGLQRIIIVYTCEDTSKMVLEDNR